MRFRVVVVALASATGLSVASPAAADVPEMSSPKGGYVVIPVEDLPVEHGGPEISDVIFLNRCTGGCTITPGNNDARTNESSIVSGTVNLSEFSHGDDVWNDVMDCVREVYAPFPVTITDQDPGTEMFHHEAIVAGTAPEAGLPSAVGGVAPLAGDCRAINNVISFSFANQMGGSVEQICWTVAQETAHAFGLDHEYHCSDPMTYVPGCYRKYFRDEAFPCGENTPRTCTCGGEFQNAHRKLEAVFGRSADGAVAGPTVDIPLPEPDEVIARDSAVFYNASDVRGLRKVEMRINGYKWATQEFDIDVTDPTDLLPGSQSSNFPIPGEIPDGYQDIEIRAYNDVGVSGTATVTALIGEPCQNADACLSGQECTDGRCAWPPPTGELGDSCSRDQECISDLCPTSGDEGYCSETCNVNVSGSCLEGFECIPAGNTGVCWPLESGGCCSVGERDAAPWLELVLFGGMLALVVRRRRR